MDMNNYNQNAFNPMMNNMQNNMNMNPMMNNMQNNNMNMNNPMMMNNMQNNMNMNPMMMNNMQNNMNMNPMMMNNMQYNAMMMQMMTNPMMVQMMGNMNMGMGNMNMGMGNMQNLDSQDGESWNLIFEKKNGGQAINVRLPSSSKVIAAINNYKIKANMSNDDDAKFIFNSKQLNYELTLAESGLSNGSKITVISIKDVEGA